MQSGSWTDTDGRPLAACASCQAAPCPVLESLSPDLPPPRLADRTELQRGQLLLPDDGNGADLWIVVEGLMMLQNLLPDGRRQVLGFRFPGEIVCGVLHGELAEISMQAVSRSALCRIQGEEIARLLQREMRLVQRLLGVGRAQISHANLHLLLLGRLTAPERIATFLVEMARRATGAARDGVEFPLPMNREDIADYLGLNSETVSRNLTRLRRAGVIDLPRPGLALLRDTESLIALTPFDSATCLALGRPFAGDAGITAPYDTGCGLGLAPGALRETNLP